MYRLFDCGTWDDPWFADLGMDGKLLFIYLFTNHRTNPSGVYEIRLRAIAFETGMSSTRIEELIASFGERVTWWPDHSIIWVRNFYRRQNSGDSFKLQIAARKAMAGLPQEIIDTVGMEYPALANTPSPSEDEPEIPHPYPIDTASTEREKREEKENQEEESESGGASAPAKTKAKRLHRIPEGWQPDDGLLAWASKQGIPDDFVRSETERFIDYWIGAGKPKADWEATWRNWMRKEFDEGRAARKITPLPTKGRAEQAVQNRIDDALRIIQGG